VACKAVIIATGGYANNKAWIKKYAGMDLDRNIVPIGNTGKMGDGIRMAWEMGAASEGMGVLHMLRGGPFGPEFPFMNVVETAATQPILWVNPRGERFCDEGIATDDMLTGNVNTRFKDGYSFCLFDDSIKQKFMKEGVYRGMGTAVLSGHTLPIWMSNSSICFR
jgi:fumarate reductase flavoprotein subunit